MTCTCSALNPWRRLRECPNEESIFAKDTTYTKGAATGRTQSQIASESADKSLAAYGRSNALPWMGKPGPVADPKKLAVSHKRGKA